MIADGTRISIIRRSSPASGTQAPRDDRFDRAIGDALDLELVVADRHALAGSRQVAERLGDQAADGGGIGLPLAREQRRRIVDRHAAGQAHAPVGQRLRHAARRP